MYFLLSAIFLWVAVKSCVEQCWGRTESLEECRGVTVHLHGVCVCAQVWRSLPATLTQDSTQATTATSNSTAWSVTAVKAAGLHLMRGSWSYLYMTGMWEGAYHPGGSPWIWRWRRPPLPPNSLELLNLIYGYCFLLTFLPSLYRMLGLDGALSLLTAFVLIQGHSVY